MGYYINRALCVISPIAAIAAIVLFCMGIWSTGDTAGRFGATGGVFCAVAFISGTGALVMYSGVHKPYRTPKVKNRLP